MKESEKFVAETEVRIHNKEIELLHFTHLLRDKSNKSNEICAKLNESLNEKDKLVETINALKE